MRYRTDRIRLPRILLAERDYELRSFLKHVLGREAYAVIDCSSIRELREFLDAFDVAGLVEKFDLFLFDMRLLDQSVVDVIRGLQQCQRCPPLILVDGWQCDRFVPVNGLKIAAAIESPADVSKCLAQIRRFAPHQPADGTTNGDVTSVRER